jgi:hypothetical protein
MVTKGTCLGLSPGRRPVFAIPEEAGLEGAPGRAGSPAETPGADGADGRDEFAVRCRVMLELRGIPGCVPVCLQDTRLGNGAARKALRTRQGTRRQINCENPARIASQVLRGKIEYARLQAAAAPATCSFRRARRHVHAIHRSRGRSLIASCLRSAQRTEPPNPFLSPLCV